MERAQAHLVAQELQLQSPACVAPIEFHGNSMLPFLQDGDELIVEPVTWADIHPGDIITYRLDARFPTGRVVAKRGDHLWLTADNWRRARWEVWREDVLGKVVGRRRAGHELRSTDAGWMWDAQYKVLEYRARRTVRRVRERSQRLQLKVHDRWLNQRDGYVEMPDSVQVNVSSRCNLRCRMCPYLDIHTNKNVASYMSEATFARLFPVLPHLNAIHFSGSGEPLFHKGLTDWLKMTRRANPHILIDLTTNGTMLTRELAEELIALPLHQLTVSFDGTNTETVQAIRRGISYSRVLQNIRTLTELKRAHNTSAPILRINYMTGYGSAAELADFIPLADELGVQIVQVLEIQAANAEEYESNLRHQMDLDGGRMLREALKRAAHAGIHLGLPAVLKDACRHPYTPLIGEDGTVYHCGFLDYEGQPLYCEGHVVQLPSVSYGNINQKSFREIWNSRDYVALRQKDARGDFPEYCRACYHSRAETAEKVEQVLGSR